MEVSWRRIKDDSDSIVEEFERLYEYDRDYAECERIITDIFKIYSSKYNIQLDENENFDHIFHQLLDGMDEVIENFTPTELSEQTESKKIDKLFEKMSEDIFNTVEIRGRLKEIDPSNLELKAAYEQGIRDAEERQAQIRENLESVIGIYTEIFGTGAPNLKVLTDSELDDIGHFNIIESKLNEVQTLQTALAGMTDSTDIANNQARIDALKADIEEEKTRIRRTNLVDETRLNSISIDDIANSLAEVNSLRSDVDVRATADFTRLQANLAVVRNKYPNIYALAGMDFSKMNPSTEEGRLAIKEAYKPFMDIYEALEMDLKIYDKEIEIYTEQIRQIDEEEKILQTEAPTQEQMAGEMTDSVKIKIDDEMAYYEDLVNAQMYGDKEYKERYQKYLEIYKKNILSGDNRPTFVLMNEDGSQMIGSDGKPRVGNYMTVDYDGIAQDLKDAGLTVTTEELIKFLQLEDYKSKLERDSMIAAGDKLAITEYKSYQAFKNAKTQDEKVEAMEALKSERASDQLYLDTFHYATNDYEFKRQHHLTAGKIGETYIPLQKHEEGEGVGKALQVSAHNLYAYTRWQNPFKAQSVLGGFGRMALNVGNIVTFFPRVITKATGQVISRVGYEEGHDPNPYNGRNDARRGARVDWYREQGDGPFRARFKGWIDEINAARRNETENAIMARHLEDIRKGLEDSYIAGATEQAGIDLETQKEIVRRNREIRAKDARAMAGTWETQGDIIRDTESADHKTLSQRAIQRAALEYSGVDSSYVSNTGSRDHAQNPQRNTQFTKEKPELEGMKEIKGVKVPEKGKTRWGRKKGSVIAADPIGRATRSREIKNTLTRWYAVEEAALLRGQSALIKWGIGKIKETTTTNPTQTTTDGHYEDLGETERVANGGHYENPGTTHKGVVGTTEGNTAGNIKMGDFEYTDQAYFEHTASPQFKSVKWFEQPSAANTQAMSLDFRVPDNLTAEEYQLLLSKYGLKAGDRVSYSIADEATRNLCNATGRSYANQYINGMFNFTESTNVTDAITQYFPERVSGPLDVILESQSYAGDAGVNFLTDSFATSHGISSVMEKMNTWGTGWGIESVNTEALEAARKVVDIIGDIPDDPVWVADYIDKPILTWIPGQTVTVAGQPVVDSAVQAMKENLTKLVNGLEAMGYASEAYDLARPATTKKEPGRETYRGEDR